MASALAVVLAPFALAQHQTFTADHDGSAVKIKLSKTDEIVNGTFHVQADTIVAAAGGGKTGNDSRDKKMNKDILKVDLIWKPENNVAVDLNHVGQIAR